MFVACWIWCLADVSSVSPSSEQTISESFELNHKPPITCEVVEQHLVSALVTSRKYLHFVPKGKNHNSGNGL